MYFHITRIVLFACTYRGIQPSWGKELEHYETHGLKEKGFSLSKSMSSAIVSVMYFDERINTSCAS